VTGSALASPLGHGFQTWRWAANITVVLSALNVVAVALGLASGALVASVLGLIVGGGLSLAGVEAGPGIGLVTGILVGLLTGGWVAGMRARHSFRFHGAITGLGMAFVIVIIARFGGSPAPTPQVLWLAFLSVVLAGTSGWLAGRRKHPKS